MSNPVPLRISVRLPLWESLGLPELPRGMSFALDFELVDERGNAVALAGSRWQFVATKAGDAVVVLALDSSVMGSTFTVDAVAKVAHLVIPGGSTGGLAETHHAFDVVVTLPGGGDPYIVARCPWWSIVAPIGDVDAPPTPIVQVGVWRLEFTGEEVEKDVVFSGPRDTNYAVLFGTAGNPPVLPHVKGDVRDDGFTVELAGEPGDGSTVVVFAEVVEL